MGTNADSDAPRVAIRPRYPRGSTTTWTSPQPRSWPGAAWRRRAAHRRPASLSARRRRDDAQGVFSVPRPPDAGPLGDKIPRHRDDAATYPVGVDCEHILVADVTVLAGDRTLLVRYRDTRAYDGQAGWFVPDAELNRREHPQRAARRILREQLGVAARRLSLTSIESFGGRGWHLIFHYAVRLRSTPEIHPGSNLLEAAWFATDALPPAGETAHAGWAYGIVAAALRTLPA